MKKKTIISLMSLTIAATAWSEGYQVNTLSARQGGMGHTGVAQSLESESVYFNPAGLGFMDKTFSASLSGTFTFPTCTAYYNELNANGVMERMSHKTDNKVSTPLMVTAAFSVNDKVKVGLGFYTPYGSNINWGNNWAGAILNQNVSLSTYTVQPTVAWKPVKGLSVGAGLMVSWGKVDLNKGLIVPSTYASLANQNGLVVSDKIMPASVALVGTSSIAVGANIGAMYEISKQWTVGANFRTQQNVKVKTGEASVSFSDDIAKGVLGPSLNVINAQFASEMPMPWVLTFGTSYKPTEKWTVAVEGQLTGWHAYKALNVSFDIDPALKAFYDQNIQKSYSNAWLFRVGAEYAVTKRFDTRIGFIVDTTPVSDTHYNPETPGMTKLEPSIGCTFRPAQNLSIDFAFLYVAGVGIDGASVKYEDLLLKKMGVPYERTFTADYRLHAMSASIGLRYSF